MKREAVSSIHLLISGAQVSGTPRETWMFSNAVAIIIYALHQSISKCTHIAL